MIKLVDSCKRTYKKHPLRTMMSLSFIIPIIILVGYYIYQGMLPFGDGTIYTMDMGPQYITFYEYLRRVILNGNWDELIYSFTKSLGGGMLGTWTYYLTSPLLIIILILPKSMMPVGLMFITLIKIGTAGLAFQYLLGRKFNNADWKTLIFSVSYALMPYMSIYSMNLMWLDAIAVLPFLVWGIEKIINDETWHTYTLWLAFAIVTNYYIGYMLCIFSVIYAIYAYIKKHSILDNKIILNFIKGSLLAGSLAAIVLIPTYFALQISKGSTIVPEYTLTAMYPLEEIFSKIFMGTHNMNESMSGPAILYTGFLPIILFISYFFNSKITSKEKVTGGIVVGILFASTNIQVLNMIWHGMRAPIGLPHRFLFLLSFMVLLLSYQSFQHIQGFTLKQSSISIFIFGLFSAYYLIISQEYKYVQEGMIWLSFMIVGIILLLLMLLNHKPKIIMIILSLTVLTEMSISYYYNLTTYTYDDNTNIEEFSKELQPIIDKYNPSEDNFHRIEKTFHRAHNDGVDLGYYGIDQFNSVLEAHTTKTLGILGIPTNGHLVAHVSGTPLIDSLLSIKYMLSSYPKHQYTIEDDITYVNDDESQVNLNYLHLAPKPDLSQYTEIDNSKKVQVYENPYALPIGYGISQKIDTFEPNDSPMVNQNKLIQIILDNNNQSYVKDENVLVKTEYKNITPEHIDGATYYQRDIESEDEETWVKYTFEFKTDDPYYIELFPTFTYRSGDILFNETYINYHYFSDHPWIMNIANEDKSTKLEMMVKLKNETIEAPISLGNPSIYRGNNQTIKDVYEELNSQPFNVKSFKHNYITGNIQTTKDDQYVMFSIPEDKGWTATVNGKEQPIVPLLGGGFTGIMLPEAGEYEIELSYSHPGLVAGIAITLLSIGIFAISIYRNKKENE